MNVTDRWMLEQMQQMAAAMAASMPQTSQNAEAPKGEKSESFQDMMNKVQSKKTEAPKKDAAAQKEEPVQKTEQAQTDKVPVKTDGKTTELTAEQAAMLAAGYAKLIPSPESGFAVFVTARDENGNLMLPLKELENNQGAFQNILVDDEAQWTMEPTPELIKALEKLLKETNDPRSVDTILSKLTNGEDSAAVENKLEIVVSTPETEQTGDQDETDISGEVNTAQPLFKDVKAAPVKVGENFQLDTEQPDMDAQLAENIRYAAQQGLRQLEIRLSPENLGELTVKLTQNADGVLQVVLHAANPKAANLLTQHLDGLNAALQGYSQTNEVQVHVQRGEDSQQAQQQQYQQADPDGHNRQQQQQHRQEQHSDGQDFVQRLRLGLFNLEDVI